MTEPAADRVRVGTFNIWNRSGPWPERLALIRQALGGLSLDLLGLQEVLSTTAAGTWPDHCWPAPEDPRGPHPDQASEIAAGSPYHLAYGQAFAVGGGLHFGNALLSRYPIVEHAVTALPGAETAEHRSLLYCRVAHPAGPLPVFVTHLNWKLHHGSVRLRQVRFIVDEIARRAPTREDSVLPPLLMGDFNAEPESDEIRFLRGLASVEGKSVFFSDCWAYVSPGGPGHTFDRRNRFAALAHEAPRRIDYIFVRGPDRYYRGEPLAARLAFEQPAGVVGSGTEVWPSDHFGVVAEVLLRRQAGVGTSSE